MKNGIMESLNRFMSKFVKDKVYLNTYMALTDNTHIEIENCKKILEYNEARVKVRTATLTVSVWGENLTVSDYNTDGIIIDGKFASVEFEQLGGINDV